jgi:hypothetical protein
MTSISSTWDTSRRRGPIRGCDKTDKADVKKLRSAQASLNALVLAHDSYWQDRFGQKETG